MGRGGTLFLAVLLIFIVGTHFRTSGPWNKDSDPLASIHRPSKQADSGKFDWSSRPQRYPIQDFTGIPQPAQSSLPAIQYDFSRHNATSVDKATRRQRKAQVKGVLKRCWSAYRLKAWMQDELAPVSGDNKTTFGGWAATLVDSLDTLWIMDLKDDFRQAVDAVVHVDFSQTSMDTINVFETTIRYLGGFLSAYDLSGDARLLEKALELADMIYAAFDTPNRMPISRWKFHEAAAGEDQVAPDRVILSEIGSLSLEFTRISQITKEPKWYDAIHRIMYTFAMQQHESALPGMWPIEVNAREADFSTGYLFSLAAWADSMYEYLPKMYALLGGSAQYSQMYRSATDTAMQHCLYRPMIPDTEHDLPVLMSGAVRVREGQTSLQPELQHLVCYAGGM